MKSIDVVTFYWFKALSDAQVAEVEAKLNQIAEDNQVRGLIILGREGLNATISGNQESCLVLIDWVKSEFAADSMMLKWSQAPKQPFNKFKVKIRDEIVTLGRPDIVPHVQDHQTELPKTHVSPEEWDRLLGEEDVVCIDTRNWYETRMGKFKGALDPQIKEFHEFPDYVRGLGLSQDQKVLIYCTGGIRCEKASIELLEQGFKNVYQLEGGILNYLEKRPHRNFDGECFVFDYRVAVDQELQPSQKFKLCSHCGQPADQAIECVRCGTESLICVECLEKSKATAPWLETCSKNCAHHWELSPGKRGDPQKEVIHSRISPTIGR